MEKNVTYCLAALAIIVIVAGSVFIIFGGNDDDKTEAPTGSDTLLTVLGNANLDETIDEKDVEAIESIIELGGTVADYPYADANNDGIIDSSDVEFVKKLAAKEEMVIYYYNVDGDVASLHYPVTGTIIATYNKTLEACRTLGLSSQIIAVDDMIYDWPTYFPEFQDLPSVGNRMTPSVETILELDPDAYLCGTKKWFGPELESTIGDVVDIIRLPTWEEGQVLSGMVTLGFITQHESDASEYMAWANKILDAVDNVVSGIAESDRPTVLVLDANS
ncbi:MAG: ABC transporter substrate-binding protein, partial [Thermoplasmata archaeon]|nr:ABC transporter substrate-binding protein [Thermoplasmata archaeon]